MVGLVAAVVVVVEAPAAPVGRAAGMTGDVPAVPDDTTEVLPLAHELADAYQRLATFYRDQMEMTGPEADARARAADDTEAQAAAYVERIRNAPADQVSWFQLAHVLERDPEAFHGVWQGIKAAARDELDSGHRAAQALDWEGRPWERARFLAIRDSFRADYRPRPGFETAMVDMAAESFSDYLEWSEALHRQASTETMREEDALERYGTYAPSRLTSVEALEQSARMAERAHTRFLRTVKALTDLRRAGPVYVGTAGQVNVGAQQVNVARTGAEGDE